MGYMLIGTFLIAGSMGALEVDQMGICNSLFNQSQGQYYQYMGIKRIWQKQKPRNVKSIIFLKLENTANTAIIHITNRRWNMDYIDVIGTLFIIVVTAAYIMFFDGLIWVLIQ